MFGVTRLVRTGCCAAAVALALSPGFARAQSESGPAQLSGTLAKVRDTGQITIGYRESSIPFSYLSARGEPIGYSIDLCKLLVDAISEEVGRPIAIQWQAVNAENRIASVVSGQIDLECGSTTINLERQKLVSFSPTMFVSGTKLLVHKGSGIRSFRDLAGRRVVVTSGTTNESALRALDRKLRLATTIVTATDHAAAFARLKDEQVDAFATDDVLLYGLLAQQRLQAQYAVVGEFLSYDPYGIVFRKGDEPLTTLVNNRFHELAEDGEIERRYRRWFLQKLPSGESLDLPMGPQLTTLIESMASHGE